MNNLLKKGDVVKTSLSDSTLVLKVEKDDALLFTGSQFVVAHEVQKENDKVFWNQGDYCDELPDNVFEKNEKSYIQNEVDIEGELILPEENNTYKHMIAYLVQTRGIDKDVVYQFIKDKKLYEDKDRNCVFVGYDKKGNVKYASLIGTNTNIEKFKEEVKNSDKAYSFNLVNKDSKRVFVFESPIELMSYITIQNICRRTGKGRFAVTKPFSDNAISLGGTSHTALEQFLKDNPQVRDICVCLNSDKEAKRKAFRDITNKFVIESDPKSYCAWYQHSTTKDWNDDLVNHYISILEKNSYSKEIKLEEENEDFEIEL